MFSIRMPSTIIFPECCQDISVGQMLTPPQEIVQLSGMLRHYYINNYICSIFVLNGERNLICEGFASRASDLEQTFEEGIAQAGPILPPLLFWISRQSKGTPPPEFDRRSHREPCGCYPRQTLWFYHEVCWGSEKRPTHISLFTHFSHQKQGLPKVAGEIASLLVIKTQLPAVCLPSATSLQS